jgi:hypothetical protein
LQQITKQLPQPNYIETKPVRNKSTLIPTLRKEALISRDKSETRRRNMLNKEIQEASKLIKKQLNRDVASVVKLPQVASRHKKNSAKSLAYKQDKVKIESYLKKPASNRSFLMGNLN